jgi:hypothetical protein
MEDLAQAIRKASEVVEGLPKNDPDLADMLFTLGAMLETRYERTGRTEDLDEAICRAQQAVDLTPQDETGIEVVACSCRVLQVCPKLARTPWVLALMP